MSGLFLLVAAFGCTDEGYKTTDLSNVFTVTPNFVGVDEGTPVQFTAEQGGEPVAVTWESSDPTKATVDGTGLVTTLAAGFTAITATQTANPTLIRSASLNIAALIQLTSGVPLADLEDDGDRGHTIKYRITVPAGRTNLNVTLAGGTGDADMYIRQGSSAGYVCSSENGGNGEVCNIPNPVAGNYYIELVVWDPYEGATLTATYTP